MLLFLALTLTATVSSQADTGSEIADGPGVCYQTRDVPYTDYENQEVSNTRKEWCWDVTKFFKCDVVYKHWEAVPVTKSRQIKERVCCEGYYLQDGACVAEIILLTELPAPVSNPEPVKETNLWEVLSSKHVASDNTAEESDVATESSDLIKSPAEATDNDVSMEDLELGNYLFQKYHPVSSPVDDNGIVVNEVHDENHDEDVNTEAVETEVGGTVDNEPIPSMADPPTEAPAPAVVNEAAVAADAASSPPTLTYEASEESKAAATNAANAEVMAAEAIAIFAKELLKPLEALPASEAPTAVESESHGEPIKPLDDPIQEHESASAVSTVAPESEEGSTPESRESTPSNDDGSERGVSPVPLSPPPSVLQHVSPSPSSRQFPVIECIISVLIGFILCIILLISIASLSYVIYKRKRRSTCVITAHRPVVVP